MTDTETVYAARVDVPMWRELRRDVGFVVSWVVSAVVATVSIILWLIGSGLTWLGPETAFFNSDWYDLVIAVGGVAIFWCGGGPSYAIGAARIRVLSRNTGRGPVFASWFSQGARTGLPRMIAVPGADSRPDRLRRNSYSVFADEWWEIWSANRGTLRLAARIPRGLVRNLTSPLRNGIVLAVATSEAKRDWPYVFIGMSLSRFLHLPKDAATARRIVDDWTSGRR